MRLPRRSTGRAHGAPLHTERPRDDDDAGAPDQQEGSTVAGEHHDHPDDAPQPARTASTAPGPPRFHRTGRTAARHGHRSRARPGGEGGRGGRARSPRARVPAGVGVPQATSAWSPPPATPDDPGAPGPGSPDPTGPVPDPDPTAPPTDPTSPVPDPSAPPPDPTEPVPGSGRADHARAGRPRQPRTRHPAGRPAGLTTPRSARTASGVEPGQDPGRTVGSPSTTPPARGAPAAGTPHESACRRSHASPAAVRRSA